MPEEKLGRLTERRVHRFNGSAPWARCIFCGVARLTLPEYERPDCPEWRTIDKGFKPHVSFDRFKRETLVAKIKV